MARRENRGFTLIEVLVVVTVLGLLATVLAATFVVVVRTNPANEQRVDDARVLKGIATWLPPDIDSTPSAGFDTDPGKPSDCSGTHPGTNALHLTWTETIGAITTTYVANYRHVVSVDGQSAHIERITCHGTGSAPFGSASSSAASQLISPNPADTVVTVDRVDSKVVRVEFVVRSQAGKQLRIEAAPKNPGAFLPSVTTTSAVAPTSTTLPSTTTTTTTLPSSTTTTTTIPSSSTTLPSTTTTTLPSTTTTIPCVITAGSPRIAESMGTVNDEHVGINVTGNSGIAALLDDVTVNIAWGGGCGSIQLRYDPTRSGAPGATSKLINFTKSASSASVVLPGGSASSDNWSGNHGGIPHGLEVVENGEVKLTMNSLIVHVGNKVPPK